MKKHIPNFLTCCNLAAGCVAAVMALQGEYGVAMLCVILSAVFDFFDGMAARALHAHSPIGKDLDSLADNVSFGFVPAAAVFTCLKEFDYTGCTPWVAAYLPYIAFLISVFSALRLAKFNVDTRQTSSFIGLPVPANALFWMALVLHYRESLMDIPAMGGLWALIAMVVLFSYLLVAELPMFSLKFKSLRWADNKISYLFLIVCIPLLVWLGTASFAWIIIWYILLSACTARKVSSGSAVQK